MKFEITVDEINKILLVLGETPAKLSYDAITLLKTLTVIPELPEDDNATR